MKFVGNLRSGLHILGIFVLSFPAKIPCLVCSCTVSVPSHIDFNHTLFIWGNLYIDCTYYIMYFYMLSVVDMSLDRICGESVGEGLKCPMQVGPESMEPHGMCAIHVVCTSEKPCGLCKTRPKEYFDDLVARRAALGVRDASRSIRTRSANAEGNPTQSARTAGKVAPEGETAAQKSDPKKKKRNAKRKTDAHKEKDQPGSSTPCESRPPGTDNRSLVDLDSSQSHGKDGSTTQRGPDPKKRRKDHAEKTPSVVSETISMETTVGEAIPERWIPVMASDGSIEAMECVSSAHCEPGTRKLFNMPATELYRPANVTIDMQSNMSRSSVLEEGNFTVTSDQNNLQLLDSEIFGSPSQNSDSESDRGDLSSNEAGESQIPLLHRLDTQNSALQHAIEATASTPLNLGSSLPVDSSQLILSLMKENERRKREDDLRLEKAMEQIASLSNQ